MTGNECAKQLKEYRDGLDVEEEKELRFIPPRSYELSDKVLDVAIKCCEKVGDENVGG